MDLSPNDITNFEFTSKMRGYDKDEVESLLAQVATALENAKTENNRLAAESGSLKKQVEDLKQFEDAIKKATIDARKSADETVSKAQAEAIEIVAKAKSEADTITGSKQSQVAELTEQITKLEEIKKSFISELRSLINSHMDMVDDIAISDVKKTLADTGVIPVAVQPDPVKAAAPAPQPTPQPAPQPEAAAEPTPEPTPQPEQITEPETLELPSREDKSLSDSDSLVVTDSSDVTRHGIETLANNDTSEDDSDNHDDDDNELIPPTRLNSVDEEDTPVDEQIANAMGNINQQVAQSDPSPEIISPDSSVESEESDPFGLNDESVIMQMAQQQDQHQAQLHQAEQQQAEQQAQQQAQQESANAEQPAATPKPGEFVETNRAAEDVPDEFIPVREEVTKFQVNGPSPVQNIVPDDIAHELDNVVAKFEEEMDKADKN